MRAGWVAVVRLACCVFSKSAAQSPPRAASAIKPLPITVAKAEARPVQRMVETIGSLVAWDETQVKTQRPDTIVPLLVDLDDFVNRGKMLAEYDARELELTVKQADTSSLSAMLPPLDGLH